MGILRMQLGDGGWNKVVMRLWWLDLALRRRKRRRLSGRRVYRIGTREAAKQAHCEAGDARPAQRRGSKQGAGNAKQEGGARRAAATRRAICGEPPFKQSDQPATDRNGRPDQSGVYGGAQTPAVTSGMRAGTGAEKCADWRRAGGGGGGGDDVPF
ncbi:hypothetical protein FGB62_216g036 [Gracilaria domingensis]|nr:hypothetical protein FGB62_216g036 [Gracilaria domingensis]